MGARALVLGVGISCVAASVAACSAKTLPLGGEAGGAASSAEGGASSGGRATRAGASSGGSAGRPSPEPDPSGAGATAAVGAVPDCEAMGSTLLAGYELIAWYRFEESTGATLVDSSGTFGDGNGQGGGNFGQGGLIYGGRRTPGQCGQGLTLDIAEAHLELPPVADGFGSGVGVALWLRPASIAPGEVHLVGDHGLGTFQLVLDGGHPVFRLANQNSGTFAEILRSETQLEPEVWQYLQAAYDGNGGHLFVDGQEVASSDIVYPVSISYNPFSAGAVMSSGPECCPYVNQYLGDLDELAMFGRRP